METLKNKKLNSYPIGKRKYTVNDNFFEKPNELNSYYAGFIAADGCVTEQILKHTTTKRLYIAIHKKDIAFLENFKKDINYSGDIKYYNNNEFAKIIINSTKIVDDLKRVFNITPKKTFTLIPPNLSDPLYIKSFIIGYLDGDGSVCFSKNKNKQKKLSISALGTYSMLSWIIDNFKVLSENTHNTHPVISKGGFGNHRQDNNKIYSIHISDKWAREVFLGLWSVKVPKFKRKWGNEFYNYCITYKKRLPIVRRKGVNIFDTNGVFLRHCDTLKEAEIFTQVRASRISTLCKINDNKHMANGYMFSRDNIIMDAYEPINPYASKYVKNFHQECMAHDAGEVDMEEAESNSEE